MAVQFRSFTTDGRPLVSADHAAVPSVWGQIEEYLFEWLGEICNPTVDPSSIITGSGYGSDAVYTNVDLRRAANTQSGGKGMKATITVTGGGISAVEITSKGNGYKAGDSLVISDLTQMAGLGSGFRITVDSGDASIGLIKSLEDATSVTSYPQGWLFGVNRSTSYEYGVRIQKTSNSSTTYNPAFYIIDPGDGNNGYYDSLTVQTNHTISTWYESLGDGYEVYCIFSSDPGNRFFFTSDSWSSSNHWGFYETVEEPGGTYPPETVVSRWVHSHGKTYPNWTPLTPNYYSTAYTGFETGKFFTMPVDEGVFFDNQTINGRAWVSGTTPPSMKIHANKVNAWGHIYQDGPDTYRRLVDTLYIKTN